MVELVDILKRPLDRHYGLPPSGCRYSSCAAVGNSWILLKSDDGASIDSHKIVIRLNNARIQGFESHVGSKTSMAFINSNILHLCGRRGSYFCHSYGEKVSMMMYICQDIHFMDYAFCNGSHKAPLLVTNARFDLLCTRLVKYYSLKRFVEETDKTPEEWAAAHEERPQEIPFLKDSGLQIPSLVIMNEDERGEGDHFGFLGMLRQLKWGGHFRDLHRAIKMCEPALVACDPVKTQLGLVKRLTSSSQSQELVLHSLLILIGRITDL